MASLSNRVHLFFYVSSWVGWKSTIHIQLIILNSISSYVTHSVRHIYIYNLGHIIIRGNARRLKASFIYIRLDLPKSRRISGGFMSNGDDRWCVSYALEMYAKPHCLYIQIFTQTSLPIFNYTMMLKVHPALIWAMSLHRLECAAAIG